MGPPNLHPPAWVVKRDGRLVPFEADKISRSLFAATESLRRPDAFSARELTDGIVHFLAAEADNGTLHSRQIFDVVVKVVRELGQPGLSQAFADFGQQRSRPAQAAHGSARPPTEPARDARELGPQALAWRASGMYGREYALREVFSRDLVAAQADGLLTLGGLEAPFELAGCVLAGPPGPRLVEAVEQARAFAGVFVAVDGPDYALSSPPAYARELGIALRGTGLSAVVNLNTAVPPPWADDLADGPLFATRQASISRDRTAAVALDLAEELLRAQSGPGMVRIDWHLGERDLTAGDQSVLSRLARRALEGAPVAWTFDRPRRTVLLAEGLDRRHPAALLTVGLHLPRLATQLGLRGDPTLYLQKLETLARFALSAAVQKRDFLRRHCRDRPAFLLDQARLVVVPIGLEAVVRELLGRGLCGGGPGLDLAREIIQRIQHVLATDGHACNLECCLDSAADLHADVTPAAVGGLTSWDGTARPRTQLQAASSLQASAERGTAAVLLDAEELPSTEELIALLRFAWQRTHVARMRLLRPVRPAKQLVAPWEEAAE